VAQQETFCGVFKVAIATDVMNTKVLGIFIGWIFPVFVLLFFTIKELRNGSLALNFTGFFPD